MPASSASFFSACRHALVTRALWVAICLLSASVVLAAGCTGGRGRRGGGGGGEGTDAGPSGSGGRDGGAVTMRLDAGPAADEDAGPGGPSCGDGFSFCGGRCVDTSTESAHCGRCDHDCGPSAICEAGSCTPVSSCDLPRLTCGGSCVDVLTSAIHCGRCDRACGTRERCEAGECVATSTCFLPSLMCGASCVDVTTSRTHCGRCDHPCGGEEACVDGLCQPTAPTCSPPSMMCGGECIDVTSDTLNCGSCGHACADTENCVDSACEPASSCDPGYTDCSGACVEINTDNRNCGGCGRTCAGLCASGRCMTAPPGSGESCATARSISASGSYDFTFTGHSANHTPLSCGVEVANPDVVFSFVARTTGIADFSIPTDAVDGTLAAFDSVGCEAGSEVACDDDTGTGTQPLLSFSVTAGRTYYVVATYYGDPTDVPAGTFPLQATLP